MRCKQIVLILWVCYASLACQRVESPLQQAEKLQCHDKQDLQKHQEILEDIQENYCTEVLSHLVPQAPQGVKPQWSRENPYPALPDYFLYPDTNPMQINGKRLQSIAKCIHKRCLNLTGNPRAYCGPEGCDNDKGAFILHTFFQMAQACTAEPYTTQTIVRNIREQFKEREKIDLKWCSNMDPHQTRDLRIAFGQKVNACLPGAERCSHGYRCAQETVGYRCRPLEPIAAPKIPGVEFEEAIAPQPQGAKCVLSKDCQDGLVCGQAFAASRRCAKPCSPQSPCPLGYLCHKEQNEIAFCNPTCEPQEFLASSKADTPSLCIPAQTGGRWISGPHKPLEDIHQIIDQGEKAVEAKLFALAAQATCGNGVQELGEYCDEGPGNGEVRRGIWCTSECTYAECGNSVLEPGESCECTLHYQDTFATSEEIRKLYQLPTTCPGRHAVSDGSEKAMGFSCHNCKILHARHMRDTRENSYFLPEFDPFNPPESKNPDSP